MRKVAFALPGLLLQQSVQLFNLLHCLNPVLFDHIQELLLHLQELLVHLVSNLFHVLLQSSFDLSLVVLFDVMHSQQGLAQNPSFGDRRLEGDFGLMQHVVKGVQLSVRAVGVVVLNVLADTAGAHGQQTLLVPAEVSDPLVSVENTGAHGGVHNFIECSLIPDSAKLDYSLRSAPPQGFVSIYKFSTLKQLAKEIQKELNITYPAHSIAIRGLMLQEMHLQSCLEIWEVTCDIVKNNIMDRTKKGIKRITRLLPDVEKKQSNSRRDRRRKFRDLQKKEMLSSISTVEETVWDLARGVEAQQ